MRLLLTLILAGMVFAAAAKADILRLRDGRMFTGNFLGATQTEIWFQQDTPGTILGAEGYPVTEVESLTFGPDIKQSNAKAAPLGRKTAETAQQPIANPVVYRPNSASDPVK